MLNIGFLRVEFLFLFLEVHPADIADGYDGTYDTYHTKRIGAGISQCNGVSRIVIWFRASCAAPRPGVLVTAPIENYLLSLASLSLVNEVDAQCYCDIQQYDADSKHVQPHTPFLKGREEGGPDLQTDTEYK